MAWPLIGRAEELRVIESALADPELSGVVICGAAGVGKSRIARDALLSVAAGGSETRWAVGTSSAQKLPVGAFAAWAGPAADNLDLVRGPGWACVDYELGLARAWVAAAEVLCLQVATQFGDGTTAPRLHEPTPLADAVRADDGHELSAVSEQFERMGDLVAALDASARAAIAYRRQNLRGAAYGCAGRSPGPPRARN